MMTPAESMQSKSVARAAIAEVALDVALTSGLASARAMLATYGGVGFTRDEGKALGAALLAKGLSATGLAAEQALVDAFVVLDDAEALRRVTVKQIAKALLVGGRVMDAMLVLTRLMSHQGALLEMSPMPTVTVGDVLVRSWGYGQSNIDFYEVIAVKSTMCTVRQIGKSLRSGGRGSDEVVAVRGRFVGEPKRCRIGKGYRGQLYVCVGSGEHAYAWDGAPCHETASGFGH